MIDPETNHGVLNDWDLSHYPGFPNSLQPHGERTGTVPFMAVDLLNDNNWKGKQPRLYRHDLEGLIWILPWVFLQYEDSTFKIRKLNSWSTGNYHQCKSAKSEMLESPGLQIPMDSWRNQWPAVEALLVWLAHERHTRFMDNLLTSQWFTPRGEPIAEDSDDTDTGTDWNDVDVKPGSRDVIEKEFATVDNQYVQELVGRCHMVEPASDVSTGSGTADVKCNIPERSPDEVYRHFCSVLCKVEIARRELRKLNMKPQSHPPG